MNSPINYLACVTETKLFPESLKGDFSKLFFSITTDTGVKIECKSAEEFKNSFLIHDNSTQFYRVTQMSNICLELPDFDCHDCVAIPLCSENDIKEITGYLIEGIAKKWDTSVEPHKIINAKNVRFSIGEGIPIANMERQQKGRAFTTDSFDIFKLLAKFRESVIWAPDNDSGFCILNKHLDDYTFRIIVGEKKPQTNQDLFISLNDIRNKDSADQIYKSIIDQSNLLRAKIDTYLNQQ